MSPIMPADIHRVWVERVNANDPATAITVVKSWTIRDAGARAAVDSLLDALANSPGSVSEAGSWYQVLASWPYGFPPAPALTPINRYPFDPAVGPVPVVRFDPITGQPVN